MPLVVQRCWLQGNHGLLKPIKILYVSTIQTIEHRLHHHVRSSFVVNWDTQLSSIDANLKNKLLHQQPTLNINREVYTDFNEYTAERSYDWVYAGDGNCDNVAIINYKSINIFGPTNSQRTNRENVKRIDEIKVRTSRNKSKSM